MIDETISVEEMQGRAKILADIIGVAYRKLRWTDQDDDLREEGKEGKVQAVQVTIMCEYGNRHMQIGASTVQAYMANIDSLQREFIDTMRLQEMQ